MGSRHIRFERMSNSKLLHPFFLFFFISFAYSSSSSFNNTHKCSAQQSLALIQFKQDLFSINTTFYDLYCQDRLGSRYYPIMMNWNVSVDCCTWDRVTCNHFTGDVIGLDLSCGMLQGTIHPNTTLFHLPYLQRLNLAYNVLSGDLPHEIGRFANGLTHLNISNCWFTGQIPLEISLLSKLVSLDLSRNFDSTLEPHVFNNLLENSTLLTELSLGGVNISSVLPIYLNISSRLKLLNLRNTGLKGKLPVNIFNLQYLEILDLAGNSGLSGDIPNSIGHLKSLITLSLNYNSLNGTLPSSLFTLPKLEYLDLGNNMFSGSIPSELFTLQSLKRLTLDHNQLSGEVNVLDQGPTPSFRQLINLTHLDLSFNNFKGVWELDTLFSSLKNLEVLVLSYSGLSVGTNNATQYVNPNFQNLTLASCKLTVFPEFLRLMKNLASLDLSKNEIQGHIPDWAGEIGGNQLYLLDLSHNFITGLPQFQWDRLGLFFLQSNMIQGPFPPSICNLSNLWYLDMSNNNIGGMIPQCLGNISSSLEYLNVKSNMIQGPFPPPICNMSHLWYLDMSNNNFGGEIPQCFGNISSSLLTVNLGNNRFHGTIPNAYEDCGQLEGLILNENQLEGEVPIFLSKCRSLKVLDLGNNHLNGTFPSLLGDLPNLQVLVLKSNNLYGPIETSSTMELAFPSLRVLDLSHNGFVSHLPRKYFQNFNAMRNVGTKGTKPEYLNSFGNYYSIIVTVKGAELPFLKFLVDYTIVDLSNNRFEREIPAVIGSLTSLIVLNLSHNSLIGRIPPALGKLTKIESLDLSWNQLIGEIPQSLADITTLGVLNLSQNHLVGRIPQGKQFNTFEGNSFGENPELCGFPLPEKCEHSQEPHLEVEGDTKSGFTWRVVMLGYGCGTLLGLVMGYLMLSTRRPKWFNAIADVGEHMIQRRQTKRRYLYIGK